MQGGLNGFLQNADIANILHLRDVAMATTFCLSMGYNFSCMTASNTLFDSRGWVFGLKLSYEDIANFEVLRDVAMATIFWLSIHGAHWCHLANTTEPSMCGSDATLCQITLTTCCIFRVFKLCVFSVITFHTFPSNSGKLPPVG